MDWDKRAREAPDDPLTPDEAQDYLGHLIDQHNHHARTRNRPEPGCGWGGMAVAILIALIIVAIIFESDIPR